MKEFILEDLYISLALGFLATSTKRDMFSYLCYGVVKLKSSYFGEAQLFLVLSKTREMFLPYVFIKKALDNVNLISI